MLHVGAFHLRVDPVQSRCVLPFDLVVIAGGIQCRYSSIATQTDVVTAINEVGAVLEARDVRYVIHDFTDAVQLEGGTASLLTFALKSRDKKGVGKLSKVAVVSQNEVFIYLVNEYKKHSAYKTEIFKTFKDAERWVNEA